jgi:hypothetical protein
MDGSYWLYGYDALGQLTSAVKYFWDGTPYAGQQFGFAFDTIGNRLVSLAGGDSNKMNLRTNIYADNLLNQIVTNRTVPGFVDVMGLTLSTNTVKVNGTNAYQKWEYFREQMGTNNASAPQWVGINVTAPGQATVSGGVLFGADAGEFHLRPGREPDQRRAFYLRMGCRESANQRDQPHQRAGRLHVQQRLHV